MKLKFIIGIIALLLLMVGSASAQTYTIDTTNKEGLEVHINVNYEPSTGTITYTDMNAANNAGITWIAYNVDSNAQKITGTTYSGVSREMYPADTKYNWWEKTNFGADGEFGAFTKSYGGPSPPPERYKTVTIILSNTGKPMQPNLLGNSVGVHYVFANDNSCFASEGEGSSIPEFPTVALPIAAILGLMFVFGRRKQE